jgi:predicted molibdopterin-dependent oxidoreductase YjgC
VFGAGGGTSSYREIEETDVVVLWGSNARETHPIFFHHLLAGVRNGARLYVVDPRRTSSAQWADRWLGLDVGSDVALSNTMAREIIHAGLSNAVFVDRATEGFEAYAASVEPFTLAEGERLTGVPAEVIRETAHAFARADRAMICWTLGITEHHNAVDNVLALINLGLLCGHVGRYGSGLNPLRGQNNVQGGGDMGAIPNRLPGFQDLERDGEARARFEAAWDAPIRPRYGWHLTQMFEAMERGELRTLYVIGENPAQSEADISKARRLLSELDLLVVQDIVMTRTAEMADVVLPGTASWCEAEGTVTNSERRVQRVRKALEPPGLARDDTWILAELARRLGREWGDPTAEEAWDELR